MAQSVCGGVMTGQTLKPRRNDTYYIPGGDVVFQVEDTLFRVHRYFFERESALFRDMLSLPAPIPGGQPQQTPTQQSEGQSDENPIRLPQVSEDEFEHFLWVFYNPTYSDYSAPQWEWTSILRLAHLWDFPMIRDLAFRQLEKEPAFTRLALAERYDAPTDWRARALTELVVRREPLSRAEGRELGLEMVLKVTEMRERAQAGESRLPSRTYRRYHGHYWEGERRRSRSRTRSRSRSRSPPPIVIAPPPMPEPVPPPTIILEPVVHHPAPIPNVQPWSWQPPLSTIESNDENAEVPTSRLRRIFRTFSKANRR